MLKLCKNLAKCSNIKQQLPLDIQPVFWYYKSGKSTLSISQHLVSIDHAKKRLFPNFYIHHDVCLQLEKLQPQLQTQSIDGKQINGNTLLNVFRLLIRGNIGNKDLGLDINSLKANQYIKKLIQFKQTRKVITKTTQIIIDDSIEEKAGKNISEILQPNLLQVQKLIETGLGLPISFMISKSNVTSPTWLNLIAKKCKAIHSDIIECSQPGTQKKPMCLQQFVYNNGFKLQHLFLRPYCRGCPTDLLAANDSFNLQQLLKVLSIIDFEGKIVLENTDSFAANLDFLDGALKKCGYQRKRSGSIDLIDQYMIF